MRPFHCILERGGERGNVLLLSLLLVTLLAALATAHFATVQKNTSQSIQVNDLGDLRRYAESGAQLALHELMYDVGGGDGLIGTELWTGANDLGRDGKPSTNDEGEGDGIPTPGEPNLVSSPIGPANQGVNFLVYIEDSAWPKVKRIVSTAFNSRYYAVLEVYAKEEANTIPSVGAIYVEPDVVLDLKGNSFLINGNDTNPDGTPGPQGEKFGICTSPGAIPGTNASALIDQIPLDRQDQVVGSGGTPSVGEESGMDFDSIFNAFKATQDNMVAPATYDAVVWGNYAASDALVTYCNGDLKLTGEGSGSGALVVEGNLTITGQFEFVGVVIVKGDVRLVGGGAGVHIWGTLLIGQTLSAVDPEMGVSGNAEIYYSSAGLATASGLLGSSYTVLYWRDLK